MTRIDAIPTLLMLDAEAVLPAASRKPEEPAGKDAFAEIFAGLAIAPPVVSAPHTPAGIIPEVLGKDTGVNNITLQKVELSPSMRLIMPAAAPMPDAASLHAFARLQGLDESAIQQLFEPAANPPNLVVTGNTLPNGIAGDALPKGPPSASPSLNNVGLALPMIMGLGIESGTSAAYSQTTEPDLPTPPAGNVLSVGLQRFLAASAVTVTEAGQNTSLPSGMGDDMEVISLDLTSPDDPVSDGQDATQLTGPAEVGESADMAIKQTALGTWDELNAGASVVGAAKGLRGQTLLAADLAPTPAPSSEDLPLPTGTPRAADTGGAGAHGHQGGGWTGAGNGQSALGAAPDHLNTGDVTASRQLSEQLVQRMGEQIAQRLMNKLAQGEWQFKFVLNPKNMGEIQVNLRMHAGSLDGTFVASQTATRDMLGDGLQRLKDVLQNAGMNVANFDVGADHSSRQGRQAMTSGQSAPTLSPQGLQQASPAASPVQTTGSRGGDLGWDVLV